MKKILFLLILIFVCSTVCVSAAPKYTDNAAAMLAELKIIVGDPNGNMRYEDYVSRAECTKVAVALSSFRDNVAKGSKTSPYSDVTYTHWAAPYVTVAVKNGICKGYLDATFRPDNTVLYEEASTMFLRVLGYNEEDFGASWPDGQVGIAKNIGVLDNVDKNIGDTLTRRDISIMAYNALMAKMKGTQQILLSDHNRTIVDDVVLISTSEEDANVPEGKIFTSSGTYNYNSSLDLSQIGKRGSIVLRNADTIVSFIPQDSKDSDADVQMVYSTLGNGIITYKNGEFSQIDVNNNTVFYKDSARISSNEAIASLEMGDTLRIIYKSNGEIEYIVCTKGATQGPLTVKSSSWYTSFGIDSSLVTVMRDGVKSSVSEVKINDVVYYLDELNIALAYSKKVTGIYEKAEPNKDVPSSVTISGITYNIEGIEAFSKLSSSGTFNLGDTITLLLGKSGGVADVITNVQLSDTIYGFLTETGSKETIVLGSSVIKPYVRIVLPTGETREYVTANKDYSDFKNSVVAITLRDGLANVTKVTSEKSLSGEFVWKSAETKIGTYNLSRDIKIIEVSTTDSEETSVNATVFPQRLNGFKISESDVLYAGKNSDGLIDALILKDITGDMHKYGIITYVKDTSNALTLSGTYEYISNGNSYNTSSMNKRYSVKAGDVVKISSVDGKSVSSITTLPKAETGKISAIEGSQIILEGKAYTLAEGVQIYLRKSYDYTMLSKDELDDMKDEYTASVYRDKTNELGRVRVIVLY
ncbi:MAG: S-layer homology domain-containing protein [Clostridia bacterium]|nr:S-layer homology domain-containing protein [Clostridia bacterium]